MLPRQARVGIPQPAARAQSSEPESWQEIREQARCDNAADFDAASSGVDLDRGNYRGGARAASGESAARVWRT